LSHRKQGNVWQDVATQHGLTFVPNEKSMNGTYHNQPVMLDVYYPTGLNHKIHPMTRLVVSLNQPVQGYLNASIGYGIADNQLVEANQFAQRRGMNMNYVHTGDKEIDRKVTISAPSGDFAAQVLTGSHSIREVILRQGTSGKIILEGQNLRYEWPGIETKAEKLRTSLDLLTDMAMVIQRL
jgi:hypothetical protein